MYRTHDGEGTGRMEGLSDGLFAIVLTLLVLQFDVPDVDAGQLPAALADQETLLVSYLLSFLIVGLYWVVHHNIFQYIDEYDRVLLWLNLLFLLTISFLPYPTEIVGFYGTAFAWMLYATNIALVGLLLTGVWTYAAHTGLVTDEMDDRTARLITIRGLVSPICFVLSIAAATVSLPLAYGVVALIGPIQHLWVRHYRRVARESERGP